MEPRPQVKGSQFVHKPSPLPDSYFVIHRLWLACDRRLARVRLQSIRIDWWGMKMRSTRAAPELRETDTTDAGHLEVVVVGADGKDAKLCLSADTAASLATILSEFAAKSTIRSDAKLTKRPKTFAVGTGRFERVVLLRFEDDTPYAVSPERARELSEALLEASETATVQPAQVLQ
jgi:hypothetical protein